MAFSYMYIHINSYCEILRFCNYSVTYPVSGNFLVLFLLIIKTITIITKTMIMTIVMTVDNTVGI